ncbi:MAG: hypothetical protein WCO44_16210 [Bacteroidota bacterium]
MRTFLLTSLILVMTLIATAQGNGKHAAGDSPTNTISSTGTGGNWNATSTWVGGNVPSASDDVIIADGTTVTLDNNAFCNSLVVGGGTSGVLAIKPYTLTITQDMTITAHGSVNMDAAGGAAGNISIGGSLTNNGNLDLYLSASVFAKITFTGTTNTSFTLNTGSTTDLDGSTSTRGVNVNKGSNSTPLLDFIYNGGTLTVQGVAPVTGCFYITTGTLRIGGSSTFTFPVFSSVAYTIPATGGFWMNNAGFTVSGQAGIVNNNGLLKMTAGTYNIGNGNYQLYLGANSITQIDGGVINASAHFGIGVASSAITYTQTGGIVNVNTSGLYNSSFGSFDAGTSSSTVFNISGGAIVLVKPNIYTTPIDYRGPYNTVAGVNITGGSLQIGSSATAASSTFRVIGCTPGITVNAANNPSLSLTNIVAASFNTTVYGDLNINGTGTFTLGSGNQLVMKGIGVSNPGNITNAGTFDASSTGTNSELVFNSVWGAQSLTNTGTITATSIGRLTINNTSSAGTVTIPNALAIGGTSGATGALTLTKGVVTTTGLTLGGGGTGGFTYVRGDGSLSGTPVYNYGTGTLSFTYSGTSAQTTGSELPSVATVLIINNAAGVSLNTPLTVNNAISLTGTLTLTSGVLGLSGTGSLVLGGGGATAFNYTRGNGSLSFLPTYNYGSGNLVFVYNGTTAQVTGAELPASIYRLTISNPAGVTLNSSVSVANSLSLSNGILTISASNSISLGTALAAGNLSGGSATAYIAGPFSRTYAASRNATGTYTSATLFPVGKNSTYLPVWVDPTTTSGGAVIFKCEAFTTNPGTRGTGIATLSPDRWEALVTSGSANLTGTYLQVGDAAISSANVILQASGNLSAYNTIGPATTYTGGSPNTLKTSATQILVGAYSGYFAYGLTATLSTWTGASGTDWAVAGNWSPSGMPTALNDVVIPAVANLPVINEAPGTPAICNDLTIQSGAILTIAAGKALTVGRTLTNNAGNSGLALNSDATGTGSLIFNTSGVAGTVQRYIPHWTDNSHGYHFLSSSVASQAIRPLFVPANPGSAQDFYVWDEVNGWWFNSKDPGLQWVPAFDSCFASGKGYLVAYNSDVTKPFTGVLNMTDVAKPGLTFTTPGNYSGDLTPGWNLLGNPFSSAITWNTTGWSLSNIAAIAKVWNEGNAGYTDIAAGGIIPAGQGFMVNVLNGSGGSLVIPAAARTHNAQPWYKSSGDPVIRLVAHNLDAQTAQESVVMFDSQASSNFDPATDSRFLPGYAPLFYSFKGAEHLSTSVLPGIDSQATIPFSFIKSAGTSFSIDAVQVENMPAQVYLTDLKLNRTQNLSDNPVYRFTATDGDDPGRFMLSFSHTGLSEKGLTGNRIYTVGNILYIVEPGKARLELYSLDGRKLFEEEINSPGLYRSAQIVPTGYYVARLTTCTGVVVTKVFIHS